MTRRPLASTENGGGETVRVELQLDAESRRRIAAVPKGFGSALVRKSIARFVERLEKHKDSPHPPPLQVPSGVASTFVMKAPEELWNRARRFAGPGKQYTTLSGLVRTAIHWNAEQPP